jgi:hypothetical protein
MSSEEIELLKQILEELREIKKAIETLDSDVITFASH